MINGISGVNFNNNYYQTKNVNSKVHQNRVSVFDTPTMEPIKTDSVNFKSKNKEKDVYKTYSCKDADFLKYDLEYSKPTYLKGKYEINGEEVELEVKNKLGGVQNIRGEAFDNDINVNIDSGFFGVRKGRVFGNVGEQEFDLKYLANENAKSIKIAGNMDAFDDKTKALIIMLITDKLRYDLRAEQEMEMAIMTTVLS